MNLRNRIFSKNTALWILGIISSGVFGYMSIKNFQWAVFRETITNINPVLCLLAATFMVLSFNLRAYRWKFFLPKDSEFSYKTRLFGIAIGYFYNNILPGRLGDIIRPGYLAKTNHKPLTVCLYSIVLERVWELIIFIIISIALLEISPVTNIKELPINVPFLIIVVIFGVIFIAFSNRFIEVLVKIAKRSNIQYLINFFSKLSTAFEGNFQTRNTIIVIFLTSAIFFMEGMFFVFFINALNLSISFLGIFIVMIIVSVGIMLPSAPAAIGVFHFFCQFGLMLFGVSKEVAVSSAIVIHAFIFCFDFLFASLSFILSPWRSIRLIQKPT